jgi:hypothetical protein
MPAESAAAGAGKIPDTVVSVETGAERRPAISRRTQAVLGTAALVVLAVSAVLVLAGQLELKPRGELHRLAESVVPLPEEPASKQVDRGFPPEKEKPIPEAVKIMLEMLLHGEDRSERVAAAEALVRHVPAEEVPGYVRAVAHLQIAETCKEKKQELDKITKLDDTRVLPFLLLLSDQKKADCGRRGDEDCLACLRSELDVLVVQLRARGLSGEPGR